MTNPFAILIRHARIRAHASQRGLAKYLGVSHSYLGEVERGETAPLPQKYWSKLSNFLSIPLDQLDYAYKESAVAKLHAKINAIQPEPSWAQSTEEGVTLYTFQLTPTVYILTTEYDPTSRVSYLVLPTGSMGEVCNEIILWPRPTPLLEYRKLVIAEALELLQSMRAEFLMDLESWGLADTVLSNLGTNAEI